VEGVGDQADDNVNLGDFGVESLIVVDIELMMLALQTVFGKELLTLIAVELGMPLARAWAFSRVLQATMTLTPDFPRISAVGRVTKPAPSRSTDLETFSFATQTDSVCTHFPVVLLPLRTFSNLSKFVSNFSIVSIEKVTY
jgi:hypothetical protein